MLKTVFRANDIVEAHIVAGMLQAEGIKTFVGGHYLQGAVVGVARSLITEYEASAEQEQNSASQTSGPVDGNLLA